MFCLCNIVYSSLICLFVPFLWWANNTSLIDTKTKSTYERLFEKDTIVKKWSITSWHCCALCEKAMFKTRKTAQTSLVSFIDKAEY